jgi:hypothetical protein
MYNVLSDVRNKTWPFAQGGAPVFHLFFTGRTRVADMRKRTGSGAACPDSVHYANMCAWMWSRVRELLLRGASDKDTRLATDLAGPAMKMDKQDRIWLESKEEMEKRGLDSPDDGDAFAQTVLPIKEPPDDDDDDSEGVWSHNSRSWMR